MGYPCTFTDLLVYSYFHLNKTQLTLSIIVRDEQLNQLWEKAGAFFWLSYNLWNKLPG